MNGPQHKSSDSLAGNGIKSYIKANVTFSNRTEDLSAILNLMLERAGCIKHMSHNMLSHVKLSISGTPHASEICMNVAAVHCHELIFSQNGAQRIQDTFKTLSASHAPTHTKNHSKCQQVE